MTSVSRRHLFSDQLALAPEKILRLLHGVAPLPSWASSSSSTNGGAERPYLVARRLPDVQRRGRRPSRRAVAIACRPATPAPRTSTLAGGTVPAAVMNIGKKRGRSEAAIMRRPVAGHRGLRAERVHCLGAADAREQVEAEAVMRRSTERCGSGRGWRRLEHADYHRLGRHLARFCRRGRLHLADHVGVGIESGQSGATVAPRRCRTRRIGERASPAPASMVTSMPAARASGGCPGQPRRAAPRARSPVGQAARILVSSKPR